MSMRVHSNPRLPHFEGEAWPWRGGDLQTLKQFILKSFLGSGVLPLDDDGEMLRHKLADGDELLAAYHAPEGKIEGGIIAVHGLTGCMDSDHIKVLTRDALGRGFAVLRVNMRGAGPARHMAKRSYSAKSGADLLPFIKMMRAKIGNKTALVMVAHSIGGAAALNMMLDYPDKLKGLDGLVSIAAPIDMIASNDRFNLLRNRVYMRYLLHGLKALADRVPELDSEIVRRVKAVTSIEAFDDIYTGPNMGYADAKAYYRGATTVDRLGAPPIPTLMIHGDNDPWIPVEAYMKLVASPTLDIAISHGGGHVGFHDAKGVWSNRAVFAWIDQLPLKRAPKR